MTAQGRAGAMPAEFAFAVRKEDKDAGGEDAEPLARIAGPSGAPWAVLAVFDGLGGSGSRIYSPLPEAVGDLGATPQSGARHAANAARAALHRDIDAVLASGPVSAPDLKRSVERILRRALEERKRLLTAPPNEIYSRREKELPTTVAALFAQPLSTGGLRLVSLWGGDSRLYAFSRDPNVGLELLSFDDIDPGAPDRDRLWQERYVDGKGRFKDGGNRTRLALDEHWALQAFEMHMPKAGLLVAMTDGVYGGVGGPADLERELLETLVSAPDLETLAETYLVKIRSRKDDDISFALACVGNFQKVRAAAADRLMRLDGKIPAVLPQPTVLGLRVRASLPPTPSRLSIGCEIVRMAPETPTTVPAGGPCLQQGFLQALWGHEVEVAASVGDPAKGRTRGLRVRAGARTILRCKAGPSIRKENRTSHLVRLDVAVRRKAGRARDPFAVPIGTIEFSLDRGGPNRAFDGYVHFFREIELIFAERDRAAGYRLFAVYHDMGIGVRVPARCPPDPGVNADRAPQATVVLWSRHAAKDNTVRQHSDIASRGRGVVRFVRLDGSAIPKEHAMSLAARCAAYGGLAISLSGLILGGYLMVRSIELTRSVEALQREISNITEAAAELCRRAKPPCTVRRSEANADAGTMQ